MMLETNGYGQCVGAMVVVTGSQWEMDMFFLVLSCLVSVHFLQPYTYSTYFLLNTNKISRDVPIIYELIHVGCKQ